MSDFPIVKAPWSPEQVDTLNKWQRLGYVHEFTCGNPHDGYDRTLYATRDGWRCPHCDYQQDWAHESMLRPQSERVWPLPCDVMLPPATVVQKGCDYQTLFTALDARAALPAEDAANLRFNDVTTYDIAKLTERGRDYGFILKPLSGLSIPVHVTASDYEYDGNVCGLALKSSGTVRYVVEDANKRLFIHNAKQIGRPDGWLP